MPCFVKTKHLQDTLCNLLYLIELRGQFIIAQMLSIPSDQGKYPAICRVYFINHILPYFMWLLCARLTPPVFWVCNFCNLSLGKCSHQVKIKPTPPSEGFTANPSDVRVTLFWNLKRQLEPSDGMVTQSDQTANELIKLKSILSFWELSIHRPVTHFIPRSVTQSDQTANKPIKLKPILKFHKFLGTFYSPSGHSSLPRSVTQSDQTANKPIKLKSILKFHKFLGTFYSPPGQPFHSPSGHSFHSPSGHSFHSPSGHSFHSPSGHSFHSPSGHSFHSPSGHSFHSPSGHSFHSPSGHSFHSPSGHSFHSPSSRSCHCTVQSLISFTVRSLISVVIQRYFGYLAVGNGCKTTATYTFHGSQAAPTRRQDHAFGHPQMRALLPTRDPQPATACPFNKTWRNLTNDINPGPSGQFRINK